MAFLARVRSFMAPDDAEPSTWDRLAEVARAEARQAARCKAVSEHLRTARHVRELADVAAGDEEHAKALAELLESLGLPAPGKAEEGRPLPTFDQPGQMFAELSHLSAEEERLADALIRIGSREDDDAVRDVLVRIAGNHRRQQIRVALIATLITSYVK